MSISPTVDDHYRLQPADLAHAPRRLVISNVSYQGLEAMTPVLHFEGQSKRLVLSAQQVSQLVELTGTSLFQQWRGRTIVLVPPKKPQDQEIRITAAHAGQKAQPMPDDLHTDRREWRMALIIVGLIALSSAAYTAVIHFDLLTPAQEFLQQISR
jgi:hypothetical protein